MVKHRYILAPVLHAMARLARRRAPRVARGLTRLAIRADPSYYRSLVEWVRARGDFADPLLRPQVALELIAAMPHQAAQIERLLADSKAQLLQDVLVVLATGAKQQGVFVEIGVGNGVALSNSLLLERTFGWTGVLAEPNPRFHEVIRASRSSPLDPRAVCGQARGRVALLANEAAPELSRLSDIAYADGIPRSGELVPVDTVGVNDVLAAAAVHLPIDYISIDTEGSELEIVRAINFDAHEPSVLTIEHNYDRRRLDEIATILRARGYTQVLRHISRFDAWFVLPSAAERLSAAYA